MSKTQNQMPKEGLTHKPHETLKPEKTQFFGAKTEKLNDLKNGQNRKTIDPNTPAPSGQWQSRLHATSVVDLPVLLINELSLATELIILLVYNSF